MLRNLGIRSKILAVLALPALVLVLAASIIVAGALSDARTARQVQDIAAAAPGESQLIRALQAERTLSIALLSGDASARPTLDQVRTTLDAGLAVVEESGTSFDRLDTLAQEAVAAADTAMGELARIRQQVDGQSVSAALAAQSYSALIEAELAQIDAIALAVSDRDLSTQLQAFVATERLAEQVAQEADLGLAAIAAGEYTPELRQQHQGLVAVQEVLRRAAEKQNAAFGIRLPATTYPLQLARQRTVQDPDGVIDGITAEQWLDATQAEIDSFAVGQAKVGELGKVRSTELADGAAQAAWQVALIGILAVALPLLFALLVARRITRPLRRLTDAAAQIRAELPTMVERMQTPGEGPGVELPDIPVESGDEIGRLAAVFNDVNSTTIQVAQEQAALRGSIAAMFVNVARRDQVLLSRQLAFIDQLERTEENPSTLDNLFKLDHLATRMRRNAESLLVLAGIDTGRRLRRPMPLSDVIRTASSEIEHYERVDLALRVDPPMVGHMALSAAHLLAELLENATRFSDPGSRVVVSTGTSSRGVVITVTDTGLGMSPEELADANKRMADASASEVVGAQRLGFFVVGRLARKLDAVVTLKAGRSSGTVATIELAPALFVPGSVVEVPGTDEVTADTAPSTQHSQIALPDTATAALESTQDDTGVDDAAVDGDSAAVNAADGTPSGGSTDAPAVTDSGLPRRGTGGLPKRTPSAPLPIPAQASPSPVESTGPAVAEDPAPAVTPTGLPIRSRAERPAPNGAQPAAEGAAPAVAPAAATPAAPTRAGALFSAFRARRPEAADATDNTPHTVEPVVEPVVEPAVEPAVEVSVEPVVEPAVEPAVVAAAESADAAKAAADAAVVEATKRLEEPVVHEPVAVEPVAAEPQDVDPAAVPSAEGSHASKSFAASELAALAAAPAAATEPEPAPEPQPEPEPEPEPESFAGAPAVTILPGSGRGRFLRGRKGTKQPAVEPVVPTTRRELRRIEQGDQRDVTPVEPAASAPAPAPAPAPSRRPADPFRAHPTPASPATEARPVPAPAASLPTRTPLPSRRPNQPLPAPAGHGTEPLAPASSSLFGSPSVPAPTPAPVPEPALGDRLRQRSALASEALAELSMLSSYSPAAVDDKSPSTLSRRTPASTPAAEVAAPRPTAARRERSASDVRSMLSGFQAGVARGRTSPAHSATPPTAAGEPDTTG